MGDSSKTRVWLIDCGWSGDRHDRLRRIWSAVGEYLKDDITVKIFQNPGPVWPHASALDLMWVIEQKLKGRYVLFTEFDFLPNLENFLPIKDLESHGIIASQYIDGVGGTPRVYDFPAAWYVLIDKETATPTFSPGGQFNDPGYFLRAKLLISHGGTPEYYGAWIATGSHMFWQRHLHDPPDLIVGKEKMRLGDMQRKHDQAVELWLSQQPAKFKEIYDAQSCSQD